MEVAQGIPCPGLTVVVIAVCQVVMHFEKMNAGMTVGLAASAVDCAVSAVAMVQKCTEMEVSRNEIEIPLDKGFY